MTRLALLTVLLREVPHKMCVTPQGADKIRLLKINILSFTHFLRLPCIIQDQIKHFTEKLIIFITQRKYFFGLWIKRNFKC